jgi:hypothetical protein
MAKTRISCPNCRQPIVAEVNQLFDVGVDPRIKQVVLSGAINLAQCAACGWQGNVSMPIMYHDPQKELLLTFVPPELGLPRDEQERMIGPLINKVVNNLPQEKRKAYLLRPQTMLTLQSLIERILEGDGITKEMIQAQQQRLHLLQRLAGASSSDVIAEIVKQDEKLMDAEFFTLLSRLTESAAASGDQESAVHLNELQKTLLPMTAFGREVIERNQEIEAALKSLQEHGQDLDRDKLLALIIHAPNDTRLSALVSFARPAMDYTFFTMLSERIDGAKGEERKSLEQVRDRVLALTREYDERLQARLGVAKRNLEALLKAEDIAAVTEQNLAAMDDFFLQVLDTELEAARKAADLERIGKLQKIMGVIQQASQPPEEFELIEKMLEAPDDQALASLIQEHRAEIKPEFLDMLMQVMMQSQSSEEGQEVAERLQAIYAQVVKVSMEANMK